MQDLSSTQYFKVEKAPELKIGDVLEIVYKAMAEKGYNPIRSWDTLCPEIRHILQVIKMPAV